MQSAVGHNERSHTDGVRTTWRESSLTVKIVLAGVFVNRLGGFIQIFLVLYLTDHGFTQIEAGAVLGAYGMGTIAGLLLGGWVSDQIGARTTVITTMSITACLIPLLLYYGNHSGNTVVVFGLTAAVGTVSHAYRPASASLVGQLTPPSRYVMIFAMYRLATNLGTTGAPLLGLGLVAISYDWLFWGEAAAALSFAIVAAIALPNSSDHDGESHDEAGDRRSSSPAARFSYVTIIRDGRFMLFLIAMFTFSLVYVQYLVTLPLAVRAAGMTDTVYGILVGLNSLVVVACELLVTKVVQRWNNRFPAVLGLLLVAVGISFYSVSWGVVGFVVATLIWSFGETVAGPTMAAYPARAFAPELRGRSLGLSNAIFGLGSAVGPILGVAVWNEIGGGIWMWCGAIGIIACVAAWCGIRPPRSSAEKRE